MHRQKLGARAEYRQAEGQRVRESVTLADRFAGLKSLTLELEFYTPQGLTRTSHFKYMVNVANAKSVFRFDCPNNECIRGDFDLSDELADAVADRRTSLTGELTCQGWRNKTTIDTVHCNNVLRYSLKLGY